MVGPLEIVVSSFRPTSRIEGRGPHHHFEAARRWCSSSAGSNLPPPWLSHIRTSPARHLRHYFFHFWPLFQTLGRGPTVGSPWSSSTPPSLGRGRAAPPPPTVYNHYMIRSWKAYSINKAAEYEIKPLLNFALNDLAKNFKFFDQKFELSQSVKSALKCWLDHKPSWTKRI